jgi:sulfite reductase (NADPH) hemoprotein beta-component
VLVGGGVDGNGARFGQLAAKVPARRAPDAVERLVSLWLAERTEGESPAAFFARSLDRARATLTDLEQLRVEDAVPEDFIEPGATEDFRPDTQAGECAA